MQELQKQLGIVGAICTGAVNEFLNVIFFWLGIGSLEYIVGSSWGSIWSWVIAILFGTGLLLYETNMHIDAKRTGSRPLPYWVIMTIFIVINLSAGVYRSTDSVRETQNVARLDVTNDPQYQSNENQIKHLQENVLDDGDPSNDAAAMVEIGKIRNDQAGIVNRYETGSHNASGNASWHILFAVGFILVNWVYGKSIGYAIGEGVSGSVSANKRKRNLHVSTRKRKRRKTSDDSDLTGVSGSVSVRVDRDSVLAAYSKQLAEGASNISELARDHKCTRQRIQQILDEAGVRRNGKSGKASRMAQLENYLAINPEATLSEMAQEIGVSSRETVRKYLNEMGKSTSHQQPGTPFEGNSNDN